MVETSRPISISSNNPLEDIWLYLGMYESTDLAEKIIREKATKAEVDIDEKLIVDKAKGLSYCLRNAHEYFDQPAISWNSKMLNSYYGLMALVGAILISDPCNNFDLDKFESAMRQGHGMALESCGDLDLNNEIICFLKDGLIIRYLKSLSIDIDGFTIDRKELRKIEDVSEDNRATSLVNLLGAVPEIADIFSGVTSRLPLSLPVYEYGLDRSESEDDSKRDLVYEIASEYYLKIEDLKEAHFSFDGYKKQSFVSEGIRAFFTISENIPRHIPIHSSGDKKYIFQPPIGVVTDILAVHMMTMYALSIIVRYKPSTWRSIVEGKNDAFFPLIQAYYRAHNRIVPQIALGRITDRHINILSPGASTYT